VDPGAVANAMSVPGGASTCARPFELASRRLPKGLLRQASRITTFTGFFAESSFSITAARSKAENAISSSRAMSASTGRR